MNPGCDRGRRVSRRGGAAVLPRKAGGRRRSTAGHAPALPRLIVRVRPVPTLLVLLMVFIKLINISFKEFDDMGKELMRKK